MLLGYGRADHNAGRAVCRGDEFYSMRFEGFFYLLNGNKPHVRHIAGAFNLSDRAQRDTSRRSKVRS
jgi:hypothetical protein